jgi:ABC-2 type transport system permease protein
MNGFLAWWRAWSAMSFKELIVMTRYPLEFVASFGQIFLIVAMVTLAGLVFAPDGPTPATDRSQTVGLTVYGFMLFMFFTETLWTIGYNIRREQKQGTLEQLYLSPASRTASLVSRVTVVLIWTALLSIGLAGLMSVIVAPVPVHNLLAGLIILGLALCITFGLGFAFAAVTLRVRETSQLLATLSQFAFLLLCAPFVPFAGMPPWLQAISRLLPLAYGVDAFRSTLLGYPPGFPELAPLGTEVMILVVFAVLMPTFGLWLYGREEERARQAGSLSEY